jgi:hypothetical protein
MKKRAFLPMVAAIGLATALAAPALAVPPHLHCLTLANGNVIPLAGGVTSHAPHDTAFHNFHIKVHTGVPGSGRVTITADTEAPFTCPPSP